jgi:hypothetical protein
MESSGVIVKYEITIYLKIALFAAVIYGVFDVIKRFRFFVNEEDWKKCFSPFAIFGLVVALKVGLTVAPYISTDDYHFGENLLGWWSYLKGFVPYVDYVPAHGVLEDDLRSLLSYIFYDSTAASIGESGRLAFTILGFIAFISIYSFTGSLVLAFSAILLLGGRLVWYFFVPFICLWLSSRLRTKPSKWVSVWVVSAPFVILSVPPQGLLLVASFGILAIKMIWDLIQTGDKKSWLHVSVVSLVTIFIFVATPLLFMLIAAIRYVWENGSINQIAYGLPWGLSWGEGIKSGFIFEAIRMAWILTPLLSLYVIGKSWCSFKNTNSFFYPALIFLFFSLFMIPYSMGRIDPGNVSRPGLVSIFSWAIIFPLLAWKFVSTKTHAFVVLVTVFMSSLLGFGVTSFSSLSSIASQKIYSPPLRDAAAAGLPNIGNAFIEESQWNRINRLNKLLELRLASNETYLDLTSRNAHYFYLNRLPAISVSAPYNLVSLTQQRRAVDVLLATLPKIALLQADNIVQDGGGLALRNPYLYQFVMDHYAPRMESGFIVGYKKPETTSPENENNIIVEVKNFTDSNWYHGFNRTEVAVILSDSSLVPMLKIGDQVSIANGEFRSIIRVWPEGSAIWMDGGIIKPTNTSSDNFINVIVSEHVRKEYEASLFHKSFAVSDFQKIPISWGRSEKTLISKMTSQIKISGILPSLIDIALVNDSYKVEGKDPYLLFDISSLGVSGRNAGLLKFEFSCVGNKTEPRMQIFWWGDERDGAFEASSVKFTAENGTLIVPLDSSPWWLGLSKVKGLRFDLDNPSACIAFNITNISLFQRDLF